MGWNTAALFVRDRSVDEVLDFLPDIFGYVPTGDTADSEQATLNFPRERIYLAESGNWCQMWEPDMRFHPQRVIDIQGAGPLAGTRALWAVFASVSDTYGFTLYDDGAVTRSYVYQQGDIVEDEGDRLSAEPANLGDTGFDERFVWTVIQGVTGLDHDMSRVFEIYDVTD